MRIMLRLIVKAEHTKVFLCDGVGGARGDLACKLVRLDEGTQAERGVVSALDTAALCFDGCDGRLGRARDDEVERRLEMHRALAEDLDAVLERVDAARFVQLLGSDGSRRVQKTAIDPVLDLVQVHRHVCLTMTTNAKTKRQLLLACFGRGVGKTYTLVKPRLG